MGRVSWLSFSSRRVRTKKTVRLVAVFSFSNFVTVVEFIVETQAPRNHFRFTIYAAIFGKKKPKLRFCIAQGSW